MFLPRVFVDLPLSLIPLLLKFCNSNYRSVYIPFYEIGTLFLSYDFIFLGISFCCFCFLESLLSSLLLESFSKPTIIIDFEDLSSCFSVSPSFTFSFLFF